MEITLKTLNTNPWSGVKQYKHCSTYIAPYLTRSGGLYTGLTKDDEVRLGETLRLDLSPKSPFWITFHIKMGAKDLVLNTTDPYDELKYLFLKNHKRVAEGLADRKATANYVIVNAENEAKEVNKFSQLKRRALKEFDKMSVGDMRKCLRILGRNAEETSAEIVEQRLNDFIEADPLTFMEKWVDNKNKDTEFLIQEAVSKNVIRKNKNVYKYGTDIIGHNLESAVDYINNSANQDLKFAITQETNAK
jgi:hypothetical protein